MFSPREEIAGWLAVFRCGQLLKMFLQREHVALSDGVLKDKQEDSDKSEES